jgi:catalase-peroxidase
MNESLVRGRSRTSARRTRPGRGNQGWWPDREPQISPRTPVATARRGLQLRRSVQASTSQVKRDIENVLTTSQDWWRPTGHYGPFVAPAQRRLRDRDGRGGAGPVNASRRSTLPDSSLDKARRLLWPVAEVPERLVGDLWSCRQRRRSRWLPDVRLAGGRPRVGADEDVSGAGTTLGDALTGNRHRGRSAVDGSSTNPGRRQPDPPPPSTSADVQAHGDERRETVALIAGGHSFGKTHGAAADNSSPRARAPARGAGLG